MAPSTVQEKPVPPAQIEAVRRFTRSYTQRMGVLHRRLHRTQFSVTEARVLFDLANRYKAYAKDVAEGLGLDPAYLSRILQKLESGGLISRASDAGDRRRTVLTPTDAGLAALADLNDRANADVAAHLGPLDPTRRAALVDALGTAEMLLETGSKGSGQVVLRAPEPGDYGWIIQRHGAHYPAEFGWDETFEHVVVEIIAGYLAKAEGGRDRCWIADVGGARAGCIFLEHHTAETAKLRLLFVEPWARGTGLGGMLVDACIAAARSGGYGNLTLWTMSTLYAARRLYESRGFEITCSEPVDQFGHRQNSLTYTLDLEEGAHPRRHE